MLKFAIFAVLSLLILPVASRADGPPAPYSCNNDSAVGQAVWVSFSEPTFESILISKTSQGQLIENHDRFITTSTVSSHNVSRGNCTESVQRSKDLQVFIYQFTCGSITGFLNYDFKTKTGAYYETAGPRGPEQKINFSSCSFVP